MLALNVSSRRSKKILILDFAFYNAESPEKESSRGQNQVSVVRVDV